MTYNRMWEADLRSSEDGTEFATEVSAPNEQEARERLRNIWPYARVTRLEPLGSRQARAYARALNEEDIY